MNYNTYNNIGISLVSFLSVVRFFNDIEYSKSLLINPILLNNNSMKYLKNKTTKPKSIEDLMLSKIELFLDFNKRYYTFLPLSVKTILLAQNMGFITFKNDYIHVEKQVLNGFNFNDKGLGCRALNIIKASEKVSKLFNEESASLYFKLRVEI